MPERANHLGEEDILRLIDLESSSVEAGAAQDHLRACAECRARMATIQRTLGEVDDVLASQPVGVPAWAGASRVRLQERMRTEGRSPGGRGVLRIAAIAAVALVAVGTVLHGWRRDKSSGVAYAEAGPVPDRMLTPGAIRPVTLGEICQATDDDDLDPSVSASTQSAVLREYGIAGGSQQGSYQIDYLVNPQLGGTSDIKNLWPQPYREGVWNARAKDELEKHLHEMVCHRTVDLTVAQREIATDWIAAYKKYMRETPA